MNLRTELDDFISIHCFKTAITGMEDILGAEGAAAALIAAGRKRGINVATAANLVGKKPSTSELKTALDSAIGKSGTRLCNVADISQTSTGGYLIKTQETVCTSGEPAGSQRSCTYTLGAVMGFLEAVNGQQYSGKHVANVLNGSPTDDLEFTPLS